MNYSKISRLRSFIIVIVIAIAFIFNFCDVATLVSAQSPPPNNYFPPGAYTKRDNPFCLEFSGENCIKCDSRLDYYLNGNGCSRFQNRTSDYVTTFPVKKILRVCDDQCDTRFCLTSGTTKGLCSGGCKYSSQSSAFYGYASAPRTANFDRCVTDCEHFGQRYDKLVTPDQGACRDCPPGCETCSSDTLCTECLYSYQRYTGSSSVNFSAEVFAGTLVPKQCTTRSSRTKKEVLMANQAFSRDYYVTSNFKVPACTKDSCQGTKQNPFDDINLVFVHLFDNFSLGQKEEATVNIYLMKAQTTSGTALDHFWKEKNLSSHYKRVFERTAVDVSIQPLVCNGNNITESCYSSDEKASVILKSNKLSFFVTKTFTFKNIILDASELIPNSTCYEENKDSTQRCCVNNVGTYPTKSNILLSNGSPNDAQCQPPSGKTVLSVPWETYNPQTDIWKKGPYAFFVMNFLQDYPKYVPTLNIEGCIVKNFWYHRYAYSFIYLDQRASRLTIKNTTFQNFYFPMGLITNMQKLTQRNSFFTTNLIATKLNNCTTYNSSLSNCQTINLQDSTFQDVLFGDFNFKAANSDYYSNEGIVLSLLEFRGPIVIQNNIFRRLASIKFSSQPNSTCSAPRIDFDNNFRMSLDRHIQLVIGNEKWTKTPKTSSVLSLRNVTYGVTIYNNSFVNNAAETGTALFIHNFENTQSRPIIIERNMFDGNFASEFGTTITIIKYERDYVTLRCEGVYLSNNIFQNNFGCPYVKGTVIVSCMPEKPAVSQIHRAYQVANTLQDSILEAYMIDYFVSVNDVNTLDPSSKFNNRFENLMVPETDDLTRGIFSKFIADITANKDVVNATSHPITGNIIDANRVTSIQNKFIGNYAYHSHLFLQGAYNTLVKETTFQDNTVPIPQLLSKSLLGNLPFFSKILGFVSYWNSVEATALLVRMGNYVVIQDSVFSNNSQLLKDELSLPFGAAITIDKHLGLTNISLTNNTFKNNQGWGSRNVFDQVKKEVSTEDFEAIRHSFESAGVQGVLITYNYWQYISGIQFFSSYNNLPPDLNSYYEVKSGIPYILLDNCTFSGNTFNISAESPVVTLASWTENDRTSLIRRYTALEGLSLSQLSKGIGINDLGDLVLSVKLSFNNCIFQNNKIRDQRSLINPYNFNSLTLNNLRFEDNIIVDEDNGYYSLRTYLYSYNENRNLLSDISARNIIFLNNIGKLIYIEDRDDVDQFYSTVKYKIILRNITIQNHIYSPDFLLHIINKQDVELSSIVANNVSANYGFMYLKSPRDGFNMDSIFVSNINATQASCLYFESSSRNQNFSNFTCQNALLYELNHKKVNLTNEAFEARDLKKQEVLKSPCFSLSNTNNLTINSFRCISSVLEGSGNQPNIYDKKSACLFSNEAEYLNINGFICEFASTRNIPPQEQVGVAYLEGLLGLKLMSSSFQNNNLSHAITLKGSQAYITDSKFFNNIAYEQGSVLTGLHGDRITIERSRFKNNTCKNCAGTIHILTGTLVLRDSEFIFNTANNGGVIYTSLATLNIYNTAFKQNTAQTLASVIEAHFCTISIVQGIIENNEVTGESTLYFYGGTVSIRDSVLDNNIATSGSRNIEILESDQATIENCTFIDTIKNQSKYFSTKGGFIFIRNTQGSVTDSTFINSKAENGGAVYVDLKQKKIFSFTNTTFINCQAESQGEAIYAKGVQDAVLQIRNTFISVGTPIQYKNNLDDLSAVYCNQISCQLLNVTFNPSQADADSGNQLFLHKGVGHFIKNVSFISDCLKVGNCNRTFSSAMRAEDVISMNVEHSIFQGWGDPLNFGGIKKLTSWGGATRLEFQEIQEKKNGGNYIFRNCTWKENQAKIGGAIYAKGSMNITIDGAEFEDNKAIENGGSIYWNSTSSRANFIIKGQGAFRNNIAYQGGGYYFTGRKIDVQSPYVFLGNKAQYGPDKASFAVYFELIEYLNASIYNNQITLNSETDELNSSSKDRMRLLAGSNVYASGQNIEPIMVAKLYDEFGQHVINDNTSTIDILASSIYGKDLKVEGSPFGAENGYVILSPLRVYSTPGFNITLQFSLSSFSPSAVGRLVQDFPRPPEPLIQDMFLRACLKGERLSDTLTCVACDPGMYTILYNSTQQCQFCPAGGVCLGYDKFGPDVNYFKYSYSTVTLIKCLNDEACRGAMVKESETQDLYCGQKSEEDPTFCYTGWCEVGYQGNLCADCQDGYAFRNTATRTCSKCKNNPKYYIISVLLAIGAVIYIVIVIKSALKKNTQDNDKERQLSIHKVSQSGKEGIPPASCELSKSGDAQGSVNNRKGSYESYSLEKKSLIDEPTSQILTNEKRKEKDISLTSIYMKILTNYLQTITIIGSFDFKWPEQVVDLFNSTKEITKSSLEVFSLDCMLRQPLFIDAGLSSFFSKLLIMSLSPIIIIIVIVIVWALIYFIKYKRNFSRYKKQLRSNIITSLVVTLFIIHTNVIDLASRSFNCLQIGDESSDSYLLDNLEIKCWSHEHMKWALTIGLPSFIIWGFGIPLFAFFLLRHYRHKLHLNSIKAKFGFLYQGFNEQKYYYWEIIIFYRKLILVVISVFMVQYSKHIQGAFVLGISGAHYVVQDNFRPYINDKLNEMERRSLIASTITVYAGLFYLSDELGYHFKIAFFVGIMLANIYFFAYFIIQFIKAKAEELLKIPIIKKLLGRCLEVIARFQWKRKPKLNLYSQNNEADGMQTKGITLSPKISLTEQSIQKDTLLVKKNLSKPKTPKNKTKNVRNDDSEIDLNCLIINQETLGGIQIPGSIQLQNKLQEERIWKENEDQTIFSENQQRRLPNIFTQLWINQREKKNSLEMKMKNSIEGSNTKERKSPIKLSPTKSQNHYKFERFSSKNEIYDDQRMAASTQEVRLSAREPEQLKLLSLAGSTLFMKQGDLKTNFIQRIQGDEIVDEIVDESSLLKLNQEDTHIKGLMGQDIVSRDFERLFQEESKSRNYVETTLLKSELFDENLLLQKRNDSKRHSKKMKKMSSVIIEKEDEISSPNMKLNVKKRDSNIV